jgi:hypothetical protein
MTITTEYQDELQKRHAASTTWGASTKKYGASDFLSQIISRKYVHSVLDWGAGKQEMRRFLQEHAPHIEYTAYDPGMPDISEPPKKGTKFDMVISCDVMEHIEPDKLDDTLRQMWGYAKYVLYNNIACSPSRTVFTSGPYEGQDLHLIQEPTEWWTQRHIDAINDPKMSIMEIRKIQRRHKTTPNGYRERCHLIIERGG